ncbi:MAG: hypothetical protein K8953_10990, partial [Proteobacteria bacterium]|nr:hypothetical protein [Pseudomonadota bacterium]
MTLAQCIANPYHADCADVLFDSARRVVVKNCRESRKNKTIIATGCDTEVVADGLTVNDCIDNPFQNVCEEDQGFAGEITDRNMRCTTKATYFDALCDTYTDITTTRENFVGACILLRSTTGCAAFVNACLDDPYRKGAADALLCDYPAFADARLTHCGIEDNVQDVMECGDLDAADHNGCIADPFATACEADYGALRTARRDYCNGLGTGAEAQNLCAEAIFGICRDGYIATAGNVAANPFLPICGGDYDDKREELCRGGTATNYNCTDTIALVCTGIRSGESAVTATANPFDTLCYKGDTYNNARISFANNCDDDETTPNPDLNCDFAKPSICAGTGDLANPFAALCIDAGADEAAMDALANQKRIYCLATDGHSTCDDILELASSDVVDGNVWRYRALLDDNNTPDDTTDDVELTILTAPAQVNPVNPIEGDPTVNFLLGEVTEEDLDKVGLDRHYLANTLDLTGDQDTVDLGGAETDGVF